MSYFFRAGWMMGGLYNDKEFISKIYKQIKRVENCIYLFDEKLGTPTYLRDFSKSIYLILIEENRFGLNNRVYGGCVSRYEVAKRFITLIKQDVNSKKSAQIF